jgi:hypothetical protein
MVVHISGPSWRLMRRGEWPSAATGLTFLMDDCEYDE